MSARKNSRKKSTEGDWRFKVYVAVLILISLVMVFFTVFGENGLIKMHTLTIKRNEINEGILNLKEENEVLKEEMERLKSNDSYIEKLARETLGLVRRGEIIYQFKEDDTKSKR